MAVYSWRFYGILPRKGTLERQTQSITMSTTAAGLLRPMNPCQSFISFQVTTTTKLLFCLLIKSTIENCLIQSWINYFGFRDCWQAGALNLRIAGLYPQSRGENTQKFKDWMWRIPRAACPALVNYRERWSWPFPVFHFHLLASS